MCKEDAIAVLDNGADAIWISNGSQLKSHSSPSTISVLKHISQSVRAKHPNAEIFIDSGIRRGTDILKCIAFGANAVFMSRPVMWGLHFNGKNGCVDLMNMVGLLMTISCFVLLAGLAVIRRNLVSMDIQLD